MAAGRSARKYLDVDGIVILDKAVGGSSNQALQQVRRLLQARKAGHCGSLDPLASGVLPLCFGEATKFSSYLLGASKTYLAQCRLGQTTTTGDAEGELLEQCEVSVDPHRLAAVLATFVGEIEQIPPMYSALKHQGKRLYQLAREGRQVARKPRQVSIYELGLISLEATQLKLEVSCSKGTYIRTLAEDIGSALGCGAHLTGLRRTRVGHFSIDDAYRLDALENLVQAGSMESCLQPVGTALLQFPEIELDADSSLEICQGKRLQSIVTDAPGLHRLCSADGRFLGLGEVVSNGELVPKRLMNTAR